MANPFSKGWKYLMAAADAKIDESADPKVQIEQAVEASKQQHQQITEQASTVIGNQKQLEIKLNRLLASRDEHQKQTLAALQAADEAATEGSADKAQQFNETAEVFASQLVAVEQQIEENQKLHEQSSQAAEQARQRQKESELRLKEQLTQIDQLRSQVDQAAMQEATTNAMDSLNVNQPDQDVPTLDSVREKIERRYASALGAQELTQNSVNAQMTEITQSGADLKASSRLAEIRAEMESPSKGELNAGEESENPPVAEDSVEKEQPQEPGKPEA
ncbi:PspA/IM30 family protein [Corynebacterium alimapuense]|uniref:PspA/IM30 family protein n=1 Tax=Corynebacterium alimapuense TaxID=1576874 RepID=A0A3M8K6X3_9CORY|nr:PspA/IM30 family protein [Corynebacterium alimapuense]RNE48264.1 hypothetical protein C5L39_09265 [Corynebacterium alimapuense]